MIVSSEWGLAKRRVYIGGLASRCLGYVAGRFQTFKEMGDLRVGMDGTLGGGWRFTLFTYLAYYLSYCLVTPASSRTGESNHTFVILKINKRNVFNISDQY